MTRSRFFRFHSRFIGVFLCLVGILAVLATVNGGSAWAHELEQDNGISAVLHIAPDDNPVAGRDTPLDLAFTSQQPGFDLRYCACIVNIQTSADRLFTASVVSINNLPTEGQAVVKFPRAGVYNIAVQGFTSDKLHDRFRLNYRTRVIPAAGAAADAAARTARSTQIIMLSLTGLVLLAVLASEVIRRGGRYDKKPALNKK